MWKKVAIFAAMAAFLVFAIALTLVNYQNQSTPVVSKFDSGYSASGSSSSASSSLSGKYEEGVVLVLFKLGTSDVQAIEAINRSGITTGFSVSQAQIDAGDYVGIKLNEGLSVMQALSTLEGVSCAEASQPNYVYGLAADAGETW